MVQKFPGDLLSGILSLHLCTTKYFFTPCAQGLMEGEASRSSAKWARIEAPHAGAENRSGEEWEGGHLPIGSGEGSLHCPPQNFFSHFWVSKCVFCCFCTAMRPGPDLQYACPVWHSRLTVARSKALEFLQATEDGTKHYLPWWWIRDKFNHCQRQNTESQRQQLSQLFFRWSWVWGPWPLVPSGSANVSAINAEMSN